MNQILQKYKALFEKAGLNANKCDDNILAIDCRQALEHCLWMIEQIPAMLTEGKIAKANRWLGFIQGVIWAQSQMSIADLKNDNRGSINNGTT